MSLGSHTVASVARELGVGSGTVSRWISDAVSNRNLPHQRPGGAAAVSKAAATTSSAEIRVLLDQMVARIETPEAQLELLNGYREDGSEPSSNPNNLPYIHGSSTLTGVVGPFTLRSFAAW